MNRLIIAILSGIVLGALGFVVMIKNRMPSQKSEYFVLFSLEHAIAWAKERQSLLQGSNRQVMLLRGERLWSEKPFSSLKRHHGNGIMIGQAIFDMVTNEVVEFRLVEAQTISEDVLALFGDKDLLILQ